MADDEPDPGTGHAPTVPTLPASWRELAERLLAADRRRVARACAALVLLLGVAVAGYALVRTPPAPATELTLPFAGSAGPAAAGTAATTTSTAASSLVVHAAGAVAVPGLHQLAAGSRVADLLDAAGGPAPDADLDRVNLAATVADGERVWFPRVGEVAPPVVAGDVTAAGQGEDGGGPVNLNTATAEELDTLPGVGPATAAAIIEHRDRHGPFTTVEGLLDVPGIGDAKLAQLRDLVTI